MLDFAQARRTMVDCQVRTFDVTDLSVLSVLDEAPRERFVPAEWEALAYSDQAVPVGAVNGTGPRRALLPPMIVARLLQALAIQPGERVLEIGAATGYTTYLIARLQAQVVGVEPDGELAAVAKRELEAAGLADAQIVAGPLAAGHPAGAPYDAILVNGAFEIPPEELLKQLAPSGRLAGIEAGGGSPKAVIYRRSGSSSSKQVLFDGSAPVLEGFQHTPAFVF